MNTPMACAIIVAGGAGTRFGNPGGKLLVDIAGRPLLSWTIEAFDRTESVDHIVVVCPDNKRAAYKAQAIDPYGFSTPVSFATGGATRQDSTFAGLMAAPDTTKLIAVHDGARPLITPITIDGIVTFVAQHPELAGAICGQRAVDTLKTVAAKDVACGTATPTIVETPDRSHFWTVQTPQVFWRDVLLRAFEQAHVQGFIGTDDASVVEHAGGTVVCFDAPRDNIKVTVPEDLVPVDAIMRSRLSER